MAFGACVNADRFSVMHLVLLKYVVHGHGRGTRLGTCLVYALCVVAFVACVSGDTFSVVYLILLKSVVHGHGRGQRLGTYLVLEPCVSCVMSLQHVSVFDCASCAQAWARHAPQYVPSVFCVCRGHCLHP